jgi:hypothetical protein
MSASSPLNSVVATVKVGTRTLASTRLIQVTATTTFAELLGLAVAGESESERATLATLPVTVAAYTSSLHLSNQGASAALSDCVAGAVALGYCHILFSHTPPAQQPRSASAFERMGGAFTLPDRETCSEDSKLSFDKALFNWLIDCCEADKLGVRTDEKKSCTLLLKAVRDALQAMDGREGSFRYSRVPESFKAYKETIRRAKKPATASLQATVVRGYADSLRGALDRHAFTRSQLWADFVGDCNELHAVLMIKYDQMRGHATSEAQRNADPTVRSGQIKPETPAVLD